MSDFLKSRLLGCLVLLACTASAAAQSSTPDAPTSDRPKGPTGLLTLVFPRLRGSSPAAYPTTQFSAPQTPADRPTDLPPAVPNESPAQTPNPPAALPIEAPKVMEKGPAPLPPAPEATVPIQAGPPPEPAVPAPTPPPAGTPVPVVVDSAEPLLGFTDSVFVYESPGKWWTTAEYLIWQTKHPPLNYPLVTIGAGGTSDAINSVAGNNIEFDKSDLRYQNYSGTRVSVGRWLDPFDTTGVELTGFCSFSPGLDWTGITPTLPNTLLSVFPLSRPFYNLATGKNDSLAISQITIGSSSNLWGLELNGVRSVYRCDWLRVELLGGVRYLDMNEDLNIFSGGPSQIPLIFPTQFISDRFSTWNQFYGAQAGFRVECQKENLVLGLTTKLAVGATHEVVDIFGSTTTPANGLSAVQSGGLLALPSNGGRHTHDDLTFVPQIGLTVGYQASKHCRFWAGYDLLIWSAVARPGDQINPVINPVQVPSNSAFGVNNTALLQPLPLTISRDFWAQGVSLGLEVRY